MVVNCDSLTVSQNEGWISLSSAESKPMVGPTKYIRFGGKGFATQTIACNSTGFQFSASITVSGIGNSSSFMCKLPDKSGTIALTSDISQTKLYEVSFEIENGGFTGFGSTVAATVYGTFITKIDIFKEYFINTTGKCTRAKLAQILHDSGATSYQSRVFVFSSGGARAISGMWSSDGTNVRVCAYDGAIPELNTEGVYAYEANTYIASRVIN